MRTRKFASEIYWPLIVWTYKSLYKSVHCVNFFCYYYQGLSINYVISKLFFGPPQPSCCIFYSIGSFLVNRLSPRTETTYFMNGPVSVTLSFKLWYYSIHSFFLSWCLHSQMIINYLVFDKIKGRYIVENTIRIW